MSSADARGPSTLVRVSPYLTRRSRTAWLCLVVLVLGSLMPLIARALVFSPQEAEALRICGVTGMVMPAGADHSPGSPQAAPDPTSPMNPQCAFCAVHGSSPGLLQMGSLAFAVEAAHERPPVQAAFKPRPSVWLTARSRAPPTLG